MHMYVYKYTSKQWLMGDYSVSGLLFQKSRVWGISPNSFKLQTQDFWNSKPPTLSANWPLVMYIYIYIYSVSYVLINAGWKHTPQPPKNRPRLPWKGLPLYIVLYPRIGENRGLIFICRVTQVLSTLSEQSKKITAVTNTLRKKWPRRIWRYGTVKLKKQKPALLEL